MIIKPLIRLWDSEVDKPYFDRQWWGGYLRNSTQQNAQADIYNQMRKDNKKLINNLKEKLAVAFDNTTDDFAINVFNERGLIDIYVHTREKHVKPIMVIGGYWAGATYIEPSIDMFKDVIFYNESLGLSLAYVSEFVKEFDFTQGAPRRK